MSDQQPHTPTTEEVQWAAITTTFEDSFITEDAFNRWLDARDARIAAAAELGGAIKALREAAKLSRMCWASNKNLIDPNDPETSYSFDRWLEVLADQLYW